MKPDLNDILAALGLLLVTVAGFMYRPAVGFAVLGVGLWVLLVLRTRFMLNSRRSD